MRARYYDPVTGRFLSEDPAAQGLNWFTYCEGNPVSNGDPTGMFAIAMGMGGMLGSGLRAGLAGAATKALFGGFGALMFIIAVRNMTQIMLAESDDSKIGTNATQNDIAERAAKKAGLVGDEIRVLHDAITGQELSPEEILEYAIEMVRSRRNSGKWDGRRGGKR